MPYSHLQEQSVFESPTWLSLVASSLQPGVLVWQYLLLYVLAL